MTHFDIVEVAHPAATQRLAWLSPCKTTRSNDAVFTKALATRNFELDDGPFLRIYFQWGIEYYDDDSVPRVMKLCNLMESVSDAK